MTIQKVPPGFRQKKGAIQGHYKKDGSVKTETNNRRDNYIGFRHR